VLPYRAYLYIYDATTKRHRICTTTTTTAITTTREWEKLAASVKGVVTIAYWDTEQRSRPPRLLGDYQGTPTIRLFAPKRKQRVPGSSAEKDALDYQHGERNAKDLRKFLEYQLPSYVVERAKAGAPDLNRVKAKAARYGLPVAVVVTTKTSTSTTVKWLSVEFRRRMLLVEVPPTEKNKGLRRELLQLVSNSTSGSSDDSDGNLPALFVIPPQQGSSPSSLSTTAIQPYQGETFSRRKLQDFLEKHALKTPVLKPILVATNETTTTEESEINNKNEGKPQPPPKRKQSVGGDEF